MQSAWLADPACPWTYGLEAWFGTHPGEFNAGITGVTNNGNTVTFTHPQTGNFPSDMAGFHQWSLNLTDWYAGDGVDGPPGGPTVIITSETTGDTTIVTATPAGNPVRLFLRAGVSLGGT